MLVKNSVLFLLISLAASLVVAQSEFNSCGAPPSSSSPPPPVSATSSNPANTTTLPNTTAPPPGSTINASTAANNTVGPSSGVTNTTLHPTSTGNITTGNPLPSGNNTSLHPTNTTTAGPNPTSQGNNTSKPSTVAPSSVNNTSNANSTSPSTSTPPTNSTSVSKTSSSPSPTATIDKSSWYAIYTPDYGFLDSDSGKLTLNQTDGGPSKLRSTDQGQRFKFLNGVNGTMQCQAHSKSVVGYDESKKEFRTDLSTNSADAAVAMLSPDSNSSQIQIYVKSGQYYVSGAGAADTHPFSFMIAEIDGA